MSTRSILDDPKFLEGAVHKAIIDQVRINLTEMCKVEMDRIVEESMKHVSEHLKTVLFKEKNMMTGYDNIIIETLYNGEKI